MPDRRRSHEAPRALNDADRALLSELLRDCGPRLHAYVRRLFPRFVDADDVLAEVFARAAANIRSVRQSERPDLYLLTVARNLCRDEHRRRRPAPMDNEQLEDEPSSTAEPVRLAIGSEERSRLLAAVEQLPDAFREVVVLRLSTDLTFEEIAGIVSAPLGTVLSRMHQGLGRMRRAMGIVDEPITT